MSNFKKTTFLSPLVRDLETAEKCNNIRKKVRAKCPRFALTYDVTISVSKNLRSEILQPNL